MTGVAVVRTQQWSCRGKLFLETVSQGTGWAESSWNADYGMEYLCVTAIFDEVDWVRADGSLNAVTANR
jgi:hypothetical protein